MQIISWGASCRAPACCRMDKNNFNEIQETSVDDFLLFQYAVNIIYLQLMLLNNMVFEESLCRYKI
jgi:hypothetical protein